MSLIKSICILATFCCAIHAQATIIEVKNVNDSGAGSLRDAVASASPTANDTILIDIKGTISLDSTIRFDSFTALTVIGPYAKHNSITSAPSWFGALFTITNSGGIIFRNLGFDGGNGATRHVRLVDCSDEIIFERCVFKNNNFTIADARGASVKVIASAAVFNQCSFIDNQADYAGAISARLSSSPFINNCTFSGNIANVSAGALDIIGSSTVSLLFNTFINNTAAIAPEVMQSNLSTTVTLGNNAFGDNGTDDQMLLAGLVGSSGRNVIKKNYLGEPDYLPGAAAGDSESILNNLGLRTTILEDGYGLMYWPITDAASDLINPASPGGSVPDFDCRNAPRALKGPSLVNAYPDAGACEYTHLRVTTDNGGLLPGSFLNALSILPRDVMHYIEFDIPSPSNIMLTAEGIIDNAPYIIDGFSQANSAIPGPHLTGTPGLTRAVLQIDFVNGGSLNHGIKYDDFAEGSILQGVSVQGFDRHAVEPNRSDNISIFGCEIGINDAGAENGTARAGIRINSENNIIGGWEHWMRNVISGNGLGAIEESNIYISTGNDSNVIMGNIIGGAPDGMSGIGLITPTLVGIYIDSRLNVIGGTLPNSGNIIIANQYGTYHNRFGNFNNYAGNLIGLAWDQSTAVENSIVGISLNGCDDNVIGGLTSEYQNRIAHNGIGIELAFASTIAEGNAILGNLIYENTAQGIDINGDGLVLPNDGLMNASHSNRGIDFPEITESTTCAGPSTITTFDLSVPTGTTYRVEFFTVTSPDPTNGEGDNFIGFTNVTVMTNPETFVFDHGFDVGAGLTLTSTVTQLSSGNTSEFGNHVLIASSPGDPSISYDDICPWETASPNFDGDTGGDFRFSDPAPADGAAIDPVTGEVTGALEGITYQVIYSFTSPCTIEDTAEFNVNIIDETFVFSDFCPGTDGMPSSVVTPGGTFSLNPDFGDGAVITADGGILSGGIEGTTYTVQYIADDGVCKDTALVDVLVTPTNETFTMDDFCPEVVSAPASPVELGGIFSFTPDPADGATIDIATGAVTSGVEGSTYTITYVVGTCAETFSLDVDVIAIDESFTFADFCPETVGMPADVVETGGFSFLTVPGDGAAINPGTGFITGGTEGTTYEVLHTVGACNDKDTLYPMMIEVLEAFSYDDFCIIGDSSSTLPLAEDPANSYYILVGALFSETINATTGTIYDPVEGQVYTVVDSVSVASCWQADTIFVSTLNVDPSFTMDDFCPEILSDEAVPVESGGVFSFSPDPADGAAIDIANGAVVGGVEGATYTILHEVGACADTFSLPINVIAIDESFTFADFCPETVGMPADVVETGGFSFLTVPGDGAAINPGTGFITGGTEGTTYEVLHTVGACNDKDTLYPMMIEVLEAFTYDDFCIIGDSSSTLPLALDPTNASYALVDPPGIETIDPITGTIHNPVEGTTYTVVNTNTTDFGMIECTQTDTFMVTAILIPEAFSFDNYCFGASGAPYDFIAGGTFSLVGGPYVGVTIDPATGVMDGGEADDSFTIRYVYEIGDCADSSEAMITIIQPNASFTFEPICPGLLVSLEPEELNEGGYYEFEFDPMDGATIEDSLTGAISNPQEDSSYHVIYTLLDEDDPSCFDKDTIIVHVINVPEAVDHENFCWYDDSEAALVEILGTLTFGTPGPLDAATLSADGVIGDASEDATYTIVHTLTVDACSQSDSILVTAIGVAEAFVFDDYCPADLSPLPTTLAYDSEWSFFTDPEDGAMINSETGQISFGLEDSMYIVMHTAYSEFGGCSESAIDTVYVIGVNENFGMENFCAAYPSDDALPDIDGGIFSFDPDPGDGALIDEDSGQITFASHGTTYGVMYTLTIGSCAESQTNLVTAYASEVADFTNDAYCANISTSIEGSGEAGGWFDFDISPSPDGATIDSLTGIIDGSNGGTYDITYITLGTETTCADTIIKTLTLYDIPTIVEVSSDKDVYCPVDELGPISITENFAASEIYWYIGDTGDAISDSSFTYTPASLNLGDNTFYAKPKSSEGCYGEYASYILYLSDTSGMQAISDFAICLGSPAQLSAYGGSNYLWHTDVPLADNTSPDPIAFSLEEETYVVSVFNADECEVMDSTRITFLPQNECQIEVFNAFSPNDDGKNDFWYIDNLINYLPNTVYIYNRWGNELRKIENYDNITLYWDGTDENGNELPPSTYFYVVITEGADQSQANWVQLVR